jgi:hypothetical protein
MEEKDPVARGRNFEQLAATAADPVAHRAYLLRASLIESVRKPASQFDPRHQSIPPDIATVPNDVRFWG